jgi:hypothetical protein
MIKDKRGTGPVVHRRWDGRLKPMSYAAIIAALVLEANFDLVTKIGYTVRIFPTSMPDKTRQACPPAPILVPKASAVRSQF